jgi:hypothetical protein
MAKANQVSIPYLDPSVQHVGISRLRALTVAQLDGLDKTLVIQDNDRPFAVLIRYRNFMAMQEGPMKVEYRVVEDKTNLEPELLAEILNKHGEEGFELEQIVGGGRYIFKRQKTA